MLIIHLNGIVVYIRADTTNSCHTKMLFKIGLYVLAVLVVGCHSASVLRANDNSTFRLKSQRYGYVHHYGIYDDLDLLEFSQTLPPAHFTFSSKNVIEFQETATTKKCVNRLTTTNQQLILTDNCDEGDQWAYNPSALLLQDATAIEQGCFSPWDDQGRPPPDIEITTGVSPCDEWNQIILEEDPRPQVEDDQLH